MQIETRGRHDEIGLKRFPRTQADAPFGEGLDMVGHNRDLAGFDRLEQVTVRDQAQALLPGVVTRGEMLLDIIVGLQRRANLAQKKRLGPLGEWRQNQKKQAPISTFFHRIRR